MKNPSYLWLRQSIYQLATCRENPPSTQTLLFALLWADQPKNTVIKTDANQDTISDGGTISITCQASAYPVAKYRFYYKAPGQEEKQLYDRHAQKSGLLQLTVINQNQRGVYGCVPYNDMGDGPRDNVVVYVRCK